MSLFFTNSLSRWVHPCMTLCAISNGILFISCWIRTFNYFLVLEEFSLNTRTWGNPKKSMALSNLVNRQATEFHHFYWSDDQEMQVRSNLSSVFSSGLCSLNPGRSNVTNLSATFGVDFLCVAVVILKIKDPMIARDDIAYQTVTFSEWRGFHGDSLS